MSKAFATSEELGLVQPFLSLLSTLDQQANSVKDPKPTRSSAAAAAARKEAYDKAFEEGRRDGFEAGRQEAIDSMHDQCTQYATQFSDELNSMAGIVQESLNQWYAYAEESLAGLAMVIASRIVAQELQTNPSTALSIAKEAIAEVTHAEKATLKINPFSSELLREKKDAIMSLSPSLKQIEIVDDPEIVGGCVIESAGGRIDSSIEYRVGAMLRAALERYELGLSDDSEKVA